MIPAQAQRMVDSLAKKYGWPINGWNIVRLLLRVEAGWKRDVKKLQRKYAVASEDFARRDKMECLDELLARRKQR